LNDIIIKIKKAKHTKRNLEAIAQLDCSKEEFWEMERVKHNLREKSKSLEDEEKGK